MATPCFMVELCNERIVEHAGKGCDLHDDCAWTKPWEERRYDVRRCDTGEVVRENTSGFFHGLPAGSMYWQDMTSSGFPSGPEDFAGYTADQLEVLRDSFKRHPKGLKPCLTDPSLPQRTPSLLFQSGPQLHVMTPGGPWNIDSRASNCTMPWDYTHRCWVRHGEPPRVTVDKDGPTCAAGAGSIAVGGYHGFLRQGSLT